MSRCVPLLAALLLLTVGAPILAAAQDATPGAGGPALGTVVALVGTEGTEVGRLSVGQVVDPFSAYDPSAPPQRGSHFVLVTLAAQNTGARPLTIDPQRLLLQDGDGFLYRPTTVRRGAQAAADLPRQVLAPGAQAGGAVGFLVLNGGTLARILYQPANDQLLVLASLGPSEPALGTVVALVGTEGTEVGRLSVGQVVDPFSAYDPSAPPQRGSHFVLVTLAAQNTGARPLTIDPQRLLLQDGDGFLYRPTTVRRGAQAAAADLPRQDLAPGAQAGGAVGFLVLNGGTLARILYQPANDQLLVLASLGPSEPALGTVVALVGTEGTEVGRLSVGQVVDPFSAYDPSAPPQRGSHFVLVTLAAQNTGARPLTIDPQRLLLQDGDGFLYRPTTVRRGAQAAAADLPRQDLAPGAQAGGAVGFLVLNGGTLARILYQPANDQLLVLASLGPSEPAPPGPAASPASGCAGVQTWISGTVANLKQAVADSQAASDLTHLTTAQIKAYATKFAALAATQQGMAAPAAAVAVNRQLVSAFQAYSDALTHVAHAGTTGDVTELTQGANEFNDAGTRLQTIVGQIQQLATTCNVAV